MTAVGGRAGGHRGSQQLSAADVQRLWRRRTPRRTLSGGAQLLRVGHRDVLPGYPGKSRSKTWWCSIPPSKRRGRFYIKEKQSPASAPIAVKMAGRRCRRHHMTTRCHEDKARSTTETRRSHAHSAYAHTRRSPPIPHDVSPDTPRCSDFFEYRLQGRRAEHGDKRRSRVLSFG